MPLEVRKYLYDIREAAGLVAQFTEGRSLRDYSTDPMLRSAVERQFEKIGEALNKLSKIDPASASRIDEFRKIISFRNVLIHDYDAIVDEVVWGIIESNLPALQADVERMLAED